jgi:uncharacterized Zn-finger protein
MFSAKSVERGEFLKIMTRVEMIRIKSMIRFKTRMRLVRHMEYHKAVIHECHVCGKQYQTRGSLRSHLLVHSEDRPHKCNLCQKTFKRSKQLKVRNIYYVLLTNIEMTHF